MKDYPARIHHVDDHPGDRELVRAAYEGIDDITVLGCGDIDEYAAEVVTFAPDLVLLDLKLPHYDGLSILEGINNLHPLDDVPVIFMTGYTNVTMQEDYKKLGVIGVIHKPFRPAALASTVNKIWRARF